MNKDTERYGKGRSVEAAGIATNYLGEGVGSPIVLLHGSGPGVSAWTNWRGVLSDLGGAFRVIAPDIVGFGHTERPAGARYDMKLWVRHLIGFLDALGLPKVSLVGNSFGGSLALAAASRHPERFDRLLLMGTPIGKFMMTPGLRAGWDYEPGREAMRATMAHFPHDAAIITDELVEERYRTSLIPGAQDALRKLLARPAEDGETELSAMPEAIAAQLPHPTLVLHGREDRVIPADLGIALARAMEQADLHLFGQCGHWVQAERRDDFIALARRHFGK